MSGNVSLARAEQRSQAARAQFLATVADAKVRLNPATLAQNAVGNVKENVTRNTVDTVRNNPGTVAAIAGAVLLFFARKPIMRRIKSNAAEGDDANDDNSNSLVPEGSNHDAS